MDKAVYIAMTGGKHIARAQAVHANNMANANTIGFHADYEQARAMGVYYGDGLPTRAYALTESPSTDLAQGTLSETGRELDVAVDGGGWIAVQSPGGGEAYTRAGALRVTALGQLQTADGHNVLGDTGPITVPPYTNLQVGTDGTVSVQEEGQAPNGLSQIGRIKLVKPTDAQLQKGEDGLMRLRADQKPLAADPGVQLHSGFLQGSNVNIINEFTNIVALSRQFDVQMKLMRTAEDNSASATKLLQVS
ncbi:MAG TPA: flagellar basal body rod protein FlgF [Spongiibacteraceae bacterium]|nr:flagellar basal body rod protein FlgF [Spongiibacteraceae bacterium]